VFYNDWQQHKNYKTKSPTKLKKTIGITEQISKYSDTAALVVIKK